MAEQRRHAPPLQRRRQRVWCEGRELDERAEGGGHRPRRHQPLRECGVAKHQPAALEARGDDRGVGRVGGVLVQLGVALLLPLAQRGEQPVHVQLLAVGERLGSGLGLGSRLGLGIGIGLGLALGFALGLGSLTLTLTKSALAASCAS